MKKILLISALIVSTFAMANEHKYEISPMIGYDFTEGNMNIKDDGYPVGGLEIQFNTLGSKVSPEISVLYSDGVTYDAGNDTRIMRGAFNGVYTFDAMSSVVPFAKVGAGVEAIQNENADNKDGFFVDAGAGVKVPFTDYLALKIEAIYMAKLASEKSGRIDGNLITMAGLTFSFGGEEQKPAPVEKKVVPVVVVAPVVIDGDDDKDGVLNSKDKCPATKKGIKVDAKGCALDSDKDGVVDSLDKCPNTPAGTKVDASGCKIDGDDDKDGILNSKDICPNTPVGAAVNSEGCPATVNLPINFENNSAAIKNESEALIQTYADFLKQYTNYSAKIVGYTDSKGSESYNQKLSEKRAQAVMANLVNKGVNPKQVSALGKGETNPIADNKTAEGRAANRRIEAELTRK